MPTRLSQSGRVTFVQAVGLAAAVTAGVTLAYRGVLDGGFLGDDYGLLAQRLQHGALESVRVPWGDHFIPTYRLIFSVQSTLFGLEPAGYHACSIALHAFNSLLVLALAVRLLDDLPAAIAGALLFAFFPLSIGTVLIVNHASSLSATAAILLTLHALVESGPPPRLTDRPVRLLAAAVATVAALGCHGVAWVVVGAPIAVAWVTRSRDGIVRALTAVSIGVAAFLALRARLARPDLQHLGPIAQVVATLELRFNASGALVARTILPGTLTGLAVRLWEAVSPASAAPWCIPAGAALAGIWLAGLARTRLAWAGAALAVVTWAGIFVRRAGLFPMAAANDRYWYVPALGVAFLMVAGASVSRSRAWRAVTGVALAAVIFAAVGAIRRSTDRYVEQNERADAVIERYRTEMTRYLARVRPGTGLKFENGFVSRSKVGPFVTREQLFRLAFPGRPEVRFLWPEEGTAALVWNPFVRARIPPEARIGTSIPSEAQTIVPQAADEGPSAGGGQTDVPDTADTGERIR